MDFSQSLQDELDKKYQDMLFGRTQHPYNGTKIGDHSVSAVHQTAYQKRIKSEYQKFNSAIDEICKNRERRKIAEYLESEREAERKAYKKYACAKAFKTLAFLLPMLIAILAGVDIFTNRAIYEVKVNYGGVITGWVFFALISTVVSIVGIVKLFTKEKYYNRIHIDNSKKYSVYAILSFIVAVVLCITNFVVYIKLGVDETEALTQNIATLPTSDEIDYAEYDDEIAETYSKYKGMDFWQKLLIENRDKLLSIVSEYNQYKVENVKAAMELITIENASSGVLKDAVELYFKLNDEQIRLLSKEESEHFNAFATVYKVINRIDAIDNDISNQYSTINSLLDMYGTLDSAYKSYVYNYELVHEFEVRYLRIPKYSQVSTGMFLTSDTNNPHTSIAAREFKAIDQKYISASLKDNKVSINKKESNDAGYSGVYSYVVFTIETTITPHAEYTITYSYSMYLEKVAKTGSRMWTCNELMYFGNEDKTSEVVLSRYGNLSPYGVKKLIADRSSDGDEKRGDGSFVITYSNNTDDNIVYTDYFFVWGGVYPGSSFRCGVEAYVTVDCSIEVASL